MELFVPLASATLVFLAFLVAQQEQWIPRQLVVEFRNRGFRTKSLRAWHLSVLYPLPAFLLGVASACAQTPTDLTLGMAQNSSYHGGDFDLVNLGTDNLTIKIPLVSYPQRGSSLKLEYDFVYNGGDAADRNWCPSNPPWSGTAAPPPDPDLCTLSWNAPPVQQRKPWSLSDMQDVSTGYLLHTVTPTQQQYGSQSFTYAYAQFKTADGAIHVGEPLAVTIVQLGQVWHPHPQFQLILCNMIFPAILWAGIAV